MIINGELRTLNEAFVA